MPASDFVQTDHDELDARIDAAYRCVVELFEHVPEDLPVGDTWTAREVLAHLVCVVNRYNAFEPSRLAATPRGVDTVNRRELDDLAGRSRAQLLDTLGIEMEKFHARWGAAGGLPLDLDLPFHGGGTIDLQSGLANLIGEYLVHGLDVSRAAACPWEIAPVDGALMCGLLTQLLPAYVRADNGRTMSILLQLDGVAPWVIDVHGPTAISRLGRSDDLLDLHLCGPAAPVVLVFYGRSDLADAITEGVTVCGGRRPESAGLVTELFERP